MKRRCDSTIEMNKRQGMHINLNWKQRYMIHMLKWFRLHLNCHKGPVTIIGKMPAPMQTKSAHRIESQPFHSAHLACLPFMIIMLRLCVHRIFQIAKYAYANRTTSVPFKVRQKKRKKPKRRMTDRSERKENEILQMFWDSSQVSTNDS